ncbi:hypothetical protein Afil01_68620 [Actinorhabdospora filicis]|uniref:Phosphatidic acid phosphatase type 2/haloperoxidase domain-containing protein n=1 Tax=Actinorhabdospora filicis TaxID=1785913 RepID=A0A9W6WEP1_9ACTN|nr:vanadium-dependent haloperoxidase [Actinorhabdospora filicis]GLZ82055.1 hypothetical protein Afil01_68620 [Actinorhabdospora filicis]
MSFNPVHHWNDVLLDTIRAVGGPPTTLSRAGAIVHVAIHDAAAAITRESATYALKYAPPGDDRPPSLFAAINQAAHRALSALYPARDFSIALDEASARVPENDPVRIVRGATLGARAADTVLRLRAADGSEVDAPYTAALEPGAWRPTGSGPAASPHWGLVKPWALPTGDHFRPRPPGDADDYEKLLASGFYQRQVEEVRELGGRESRSRTEDQTRLAHFWANDLDGTYKPPGQHYAHTKAIALSYKLPVVENARLFALLSLALADAAIAAWDVKYLGPVDVWRPETAIHLAGSDGRPETAPDPSWRPLSADRSGVSFTPPFPAYVSGHATFAGAWAETLRLFLGTDAVEFAATTDDPHAKGAVRRFRSLTNAAEEDAISRVYLGVHYRFDADAGLDLGRSVAGHVFANFLPK